MLNEDLDKKLQLPKMPDTFRAFFAVAIPIELQKKITMLIKPLKRISSATRSIDYAKIDIP